MALARTTRATLVAVVLAALGSSFALLAHVAGRSADDTVPVALDENDPERERVGDVIYKGGIDISVMGQNVGGLSALRWDEDSRRLLALTDDARWVWLTLEEPEGKLAGLVDVEVGPLLGLTGEPLTGKAEGDSESLTRTATDGWLVGFERDHRVWTYRDLAEPPAESGIDPVALLGAMEKNSGLEAMAISSTQGWLGCAERAPIAARANCVWIDTTGARRDFAVAPPAGIGDPPPVPTDADTSSDGDTYILLRSYEPGQGNTIAIVAFGPGGERRDVLSLGRPFTVDNFEGLAVREEGQSTFLYIVSDDNFSSGQRTLLMKFEVLPSR